MTKAAKVALGLLTDVGTAAERFVANETDEHKEALRKAVEAMQAFAKHVDHDQPDRMAP